MEEIFYKRALYLKWRVKGCIEYTDKKRYDRLTEKYRKEKLINYLKVEMLMWI